MRAHLNECIYEHPFSVDINDKKFLNVYPDNEDAAHQLLLQNIAKYVGVETANVTITAGADDALALIAAHAHTIYKYSPSYMFLNGLGKRVYDVETPPTERWRAMDFYRPAPGSAIYVCNPCNPTNDLWEREDYLRLCRDYPQCAVIVDEAYMDFHNMDQSYAHIDNYDNLFYVRTMSKLFGIAGLRLGYFVHNRAFVPAHYCFKRTTSIAKTFGNCIFNNIAFYRSVKARIDDVKARLGTWSPTNFVFLRTRARDRAAIKQFANDRDIMMRFGYGNGVRLTLQMDMDTEMIRDFIGKYDVMPDIRGYYFSLDARIALANLLREFIGAMGQIVWWADGGTRIGAERHGTIIPWDDDIDVAIFERDATRVAKVLGAHFNIQKNKKTGLYYQVCARSFVGHPSDTLHIDIFPFIREGNQYMHADARFREQRENRGNFTYAAGQLLPLRIVPFYDFTINVPNAAIPAEFNEMKIFNGDELIYRE